MSLGPLEALTSVQTQPVTVPGSKEAPSARGCALQPLRHRGGSDQSTMSP